MSKTFDPRHLDIPALAQSGAPLQGESALSDWPRLMHEHQSGDLPSLRWQLQAQRLTLPGLGEHLVLDLHARVDLQLQCQRCLQPCTESIDAQRRFVFVADEATALQLDDDLEDDVLVLSRDFDALALIEDELILCLPLVPRHEQCPQALPNRAADPQAEAVADRPHPFAALAALKKGE